MSILIAAGRVIADTELPTAAALGDAVANPTTAQVGAATEVFDGTTWARLRSALAMTDAHNGSGVAATHNMLWNGTTFEREQTSRHFTALASAAYTTTQSPAQVINRGHRGIMLQLGISSAGTGSLSFLVAFYTTGGAGGVRVLTIEAITTTQWVIIYPGVTSNNMDLSLGNSQGIAFSLLSLPLAKEWAIAVVPSDSSSWTYQVNASLLT